MFDEYFRALTKEKRDQIYQKGKNGLEKEEGEAIEQLRTLRYLPKKGLFSQEQDAFLMSILDLLYVGKELERGNNGKQIKKMEEEAEARLGLSCCTSQNRPYFAKEYENVFHFYIELGKKDKNYSRGLFQLRVLKPEQVQEKVRKDTELLASCLPEKTGKRELYAPFCEGVREAFYQYLEKERKREEEDNF